MPEVTVEPGHVRPLWAGHPWVYAQAVHHIEGGAVAGDEVDVVDTRGNFLGRGLYSPGSAIVVRLYTRDQSRHVDGALFRQRLTEAVALRDRIGLPASDTNAYRVVHAEGDGLPGLVVDRFGDVVVVQLGTIGVKRHEAGVLDAIEETLAPTTILDRSSPRIAKLEGFETADGVVRGAPVDRLRFVERGIRWEVPLEAKQKTGFYVDQRPLRARVEELAGGRRVLDAYCYVGAFALAAARGGAHAVTAVDESGVAIEVAGECARLNKLDPVITFHRGDALHAMTRAGREGGYDLVVCDPPKLAPGRGARKKALSVMRRVAAAGCRATRPGGLLVISSCSGVISMADLTRSVALGARDTNVSAVVLERHFQGPDHPVPAAFNEGLYLRSLIVEVAAR